MSLNQIVLQDTVRTCIWVYMSIEFHLPQYEILQPFVCYSQDYKTSRILPPKALDWKHPQNLKEEAPFKHLCESCEEVFETKGLFPLSTWCPHCSKG